MRFNNFFSTLLVLFFVLIAKITIAHPGGHYHNKDGAVLKTWVLKNGKTVKGNFSMSNATTVMLEQYDGNMIKLALADLSEQDQKFANFKVKKLQEFNQLHNESESFQEITLFNYGSLFISILLACLIFMLLHKLVKSYKTAAYNIISVRNIAFVIPTLFVLIIACKKSTDNIATTSSIPKTRTSFLDSAFNPYKPAVSTSWGDTYFNISSNGIPAHNMMVGITSWQQQVPIPQSYTGTNSWSIPLQPIYATTPLSTRTNLMKGAVALAVNGIPIFNALNNRGEDAYLIGELDNWGGHCGKGDDYHYHAAPLHLASTNNLPIAFALDGFAVYGSKEPDGATMLSLDTCHGHLGSNGVYHYHGTNTYPYVIGAMKGVVTTDPSTPAPENQILPQAFASPLRPATSPLNGARITAYVSTGVNAYKLTYQRGTKFGYVEYSWNAANRYTFILTDTAGVVTTNNYQR